MFDTPQIPMVVMFKYPRFVVMFWFRRVWGDASSYLFPIWENPVVAMKTPVAFVCAEESAHSLNNCPPPPIFCREKRNPPRGRGGDGVLMQGTPPQSEGVGASSTEK